MKFRSLISVSVGGLAMLGLTLGMTSCQYFQKLPAVTPAPVTPTDSFTQMQQQYFGMLDFRAKPDKVQGIPVFAANLNNLATSERQKFSSGALTSAADQERAGLIFIYDALMTLNNTKMACSNARWLHELQRTRRFTPVSASDDEELAARAQYALDELNDAAKLRPDDHRIDSWLASARADLELMQTGHLSDQTLGGLIDAIPARPTFNLWTAFIIFQNQPASSSLFSELAGNAKNFVDQVNAGTDACTERPEDCANGKLAPHNYQASVTELGDVFARQAEYLYSEGQTANAAAMVQYAKGTYAQLTSTAQLQTSSLWLDYGTVAPRLAYLAKLAPGHATVGAFAKLQGYSHAYECASCHGR